jgi:hypothetical protein
MLPITIVLRVNLEVTGININVRGCPAPDTVYKGYKANSAA